MFNHQWRLYLYFWVLGFDYAQPPESLERFPSLFMSWFNVAPTLFIPLLFMKYPVTLLTVLLGVAGCRSYSAGVKLAKLRINGKRANARIVDRFPQYGDGRRDGCIVMPEIRLDISTTGGSVFGGVVSAAERPAGRLRGAVVTVETASGGRYQQATGEGGTFSFRTAEKIRVLSVDCLNYRRFVARF